MVPLLQAVDLMCSQATSEHCQAWLVWMRSIATQGDTYYAPLKPTDSRTFNNWQSWRLLIRAMVAVVSNDPELTRSTRSMLSAHISRNINPDGSSIDFAERDALHYHQYDLEPLVDMQLFTPDVVDDRATSSILRGLQFMQPFVTGAQTHLEFVHTSVKFDLERRNAHIPGFANEPWNPKEARPLLRLARAVFADIRPWTASVVDDQYDPRLKQLVALLETP